MDEELLAISNQQEGEEPDEVLQEDDFNEVFVEEKGDEGKSILGALDFDSEEDLSDEEDLDDATI